IAERLGWLNLELAGFWELVEMQRRLAPLPQLLVDIGRHPSPLAGRLRKTANPCFPGLGGTFTSPNVVPLKCQQGKCRTRCWAHAAAGAGAPRAGSDFREPLMARARSLNAPTLSAGANRNPCAITTPRALR